MSNGVLPPRATMHGEFPRAAQPPAHARPPAAAPDEARRGVAGGTIPPDPAWTSGNDVRLLIDMPAVVRDMLPAIAAAQSVVNVALFSLLPDGAGLQLGEALMTKAREGVEVNVVIDWTGSMQIPGSPARGMVDRMRAAGVSVIANFPYLSSNPAARHIDHRKLFVVDGRTAWVGGMNFSAAYADWHDVMARLSGPAAAQAGQHFLDRWTTLGGPVSARHRAALAAHAQAGSAPARDARTGATLATKAGRAAVLYNAPDQRVHQLTQVYLSRIRSAKRRVWVITPFIGDRTVVRALAAAAKRGVEVRVLTNRKAMMGLEIIPLFTRSFYRELIEAGVHVGEVGNRVHAKALVADDEALVSSLNLTRRAGYHDHEMGVLSDDAAFVQQLADMVQRNHVSAREVTDAHMNAPVQRAVSSLVNSLLLEY